MHKNLQKEYSLNYSVITVTLDSAKTLRRTIDSVIVQAIPPAEYIFVDGGSKDETISIINSYDFAKRGIKFKLESQKEKNGIYGAINQGIRDASKDIIFILHSDDWFEPGAAEAVLAKFAENPDCEIVLSYAYFHPQNAQSFLRQQRPFYLFPFLMPIIHPAAFVRKSAYEKYGLYDEKYRISADYDFFYKVYKRGAVFCEIRKPLVNIELGGYANSNRQSARLETLEIAKKYSGNLLFTYLAYFARKFLGR